MSLYDDKSTVDDGEKPSANSNPQSPIDSSSPNQMKPRIKRKEKIPLTLKNLCCSENSFFFNLFWGIYLFLTQTLSLIVKNFISMAVHPFNTLLRIVFPAFVIVGLVALNYFSMDNEKKENEEGSVGLHPKPQKFPRLPNFDDEISLVWAPCYSAVNRTAAQVERIKNAFYPIMQNIAVFNDKGMDPYNKKAKKLINPPLDTCFMSVEDVWENCRSSICPVYDTNVLESLLGPKGILFNFDFPPRPPTQSKVKSAIPFTATSRSGLKGSSSTKNRRIHGAISFHFAEDPLIMALRMKDANDYIPMKEMQTRVHYRIYYNSTKISSQPFFPVSRSSPFDYSSSILRAVDEAIIQKAKNETFVNPDSTAELLASRKPFPATGGDNIEKDKLVMMVGALFFFLAVYLSNISIHYSVNNERDLKLREAMRMMGLSNSAYWVSWLITETLVNFCVVVIIMCVGYASRLVFFASTNVVPIFLLFFLMGEWILTLFMLLSTIVKSNTLTNITAFGVFIIGCCFLFFFIDWTVGLANVSYTDAVNLPLGVKAYNLNFLDFLNVFPFFNFGKVCYDISLSAKQVLDGNRWADGRGFSLKDMFKLHVYDSYTVLTSFPEKFFHTIDSPIDFDNVVPDSYGRSRAWYFFLQPSYWGIQQLFCCGNSKDRIAVDFAAHSAKFHSVLPDTDKDIFEEYQRVVKATEQESELPIEDQKYPVKIIKLSKTYRGGLFNIGNSASKNALDNLTLCAEWGSVLVILGHNGSGKSTAVNALVGLQRPSAGDALLFGYSSVNNSQSVQQIIGVCFQNDVIFPELSGMMHMILFATLKGIPVLKQYSQIKEKLNDVMMWNFRHQTASTYSGGMKRRLMVAISMLGDPKCVFLDEPTSGMDPSVKRSIWDLITRYKKNRVIVLTTHSMEEAEAIGDKIAILALGRLRAVGSSLHLKNRFGAGYSIDFCSNAKNAETLKNQIAIISPNSKLTSQVEFQLHYSLPMNLGSPEILELFKFIEKQSARRSSKPEKQVIEYQTFGENEQELVENKNNEEEDGILIKDWILAHTTLEEVFLRLTHGKGTSEASGVSNEDIVQQAKDEFGNASGAGAQLNIKLFDETSEKILGFVRISEKNTLQDVRDFINEMKILQNSQQFENDSENLDFLFVVAGGVPISKTQENVLLAQDFLPCVLIKVSLKPIIDLGKPKLENSEEQEKLIERLIAENEKLKEENSFLKEQINSK